MPLGPNMLRQVDAVFGALLRAGLPRRDAFSIGTTFAINFMGYSLFIDANNPVRQIERSGESPETAKELWAQMLAALPAECGPELCCAQDLLRVRHAGGADMFEEGLDFFIDGVRARLLRLESAALT